MRVETTMPPGLAAVANGRDHIRTAEMARAFSAANQTVRKHHSQHGDFYGVKPVKVGKQLLWPVAEIAAVLNGRAA